MSFYAFTCIRFWNASTNDLGLSPGFGLNGDAYLVSAPGSYNLGQVGSWAVGDIAFFALDRWVRIPSGGVDGVDVATVTAMIAAAQPNLAPYALISSLAAYAPISGGLLQFADISSAQLASLLTDPVGYSAGAKALFSISPAITGAPTVPTGTQGAGGSQIASQAYADTSAAAAAAAVAGGLPTGAIVATASRVLPAGGYDWANGGTLLRSAQPALFAALVLSATVTMTIATPGVITWTGHILQNGDPVKFKTTGALPTGIVAGTTYYVVGAATNTFQLATTPHGTAFATTGSQSGVHTAISAPHGDGDGSTTFNKPDRRGNLGVGHDVMFNAAAGRITFASSGQNGNSLGALLGEDAHQLLVAEIPSGLGTFVTGISGLPSGNAIDAATAGGSFSNVPAGTTGSAGGSGGKHNNIPPGLVTYYLVKL